MEKSKTPAMQFDRDSGTLTIRLEGFEGSRLLSLQKAILLGIEEIGCSENRDGEDYKDALWNLTWLLRDIMLDESQTNVALGGRPYAQPKNGEVVKQP
jgi:hypothetical protein